ncbi:hypothetical protein [Hyalangium minutum]|uniref:Uncharacterized protein n=1 Tax=Hyalangium minutum TaxID=394096 RepID=A0A085WN97_9BACT|nr:hypothetical protein [Hyalangium minutum]KFE69160.1 hypothetical protein DB31_7062 [Hyalangium minutum]
MAKKTFALEPGGPKRLEVSWGMFWKNFTVTLDGKQVGTVEGGQKELKKGVEFRLPDGSDLRVQLVSGALNVELQVTRNGAALPGSASDPAQRVQSAAYLLYFFAGLNTLLGVVAMLIDNEVLDRLGMGLGSIIFGAIVATLGFFTSRHSRVAPMLAIVLYVADTLYTFVASVEAGGRSPGAGIIVRVWVIWTLWKAFQAAGELARQESSGPGLSPSP